MFSLVSMLSIPSMELCFCELDQCFDVIYSREVKKIQKSIW